MLDFDAIRRTMMSELTLDRDTVIQRMREALHRRSGKPWSVRGLDRSSNTIMITAPPERRQLVRGDVARGDGSATPTASERKLYDVLEGIGYMTPDDAAELRELLGLERPVYDAGEKVKLNRRIEMLARCETGRPPTRAYLVQLFGKAGKWWKALRALVEENDDPRDPVTEEDLLPLLGCDEAEVRQEALLELGKLESTPSGRVTTPPTR